MYSPTNIYPDVWRYIITPKATLLDCIQLQRTNSRLRGVRANDITAFQIAISLHERCFLAGKSGEPDIIELMISGVTIPYHARGRNTDKNYRSKKVLYGAVEGGHLALTKKYIRVMHPRSSNVPKLIEHTARGGDLRIMKLLIVNDCCYYKHNPFSMAQRYAYRAGSMENIVDSAVKGAVRGSHKHVIKFILKQFRVDQKTFTYALYLAARNGDNDMIDFLVANGATAITHTLQSAAQHGKLNTVKHIVECYGKNHDIEDVLCEAVKTSQIPIIHWALDNGATKINDALDLALSCDPPHVNIITMLIQRGAITGKAFAYAYDTHNTELLQLLYATAMEPWSNK